MIRTSCFRAMSVAVILFTLTGCDAAAAGVPGERLTLTEAVEMALERYPAMGVSQASVEESGGGVREARAAWFPVLSISAGAQQYEEPMPVTPIHGFQFGLAPPFDETITLYSLNLEYTLFDGGGRLAGLRRAGELHRAALASLDGTRQDVTARVVSVYLGVLARQEILSAHDHRVAALESELARVEQFFREERSARVEVLRAEANLAAAEAEKVRARTALEVTERELALLVGADLERVRAEGLVGVTLSGSAHDPGPRNELISRALLSNSSVQEARHMRDAAKQGSAMAKSARWPRLLLDGSLFDQGDLEGNRVTEWKAAAVLNLPLFTGGMTTGRIARAKAAERGALEGLRLREYEVTKALDWALAALEEARARVESLTEAVEATEEVVKIEKLLLEAGSGTQTDYLDAEANLVTARANLVEARHGEIMARVDLARLLGELDGEWLSRHLEDHP
ncbi:MAG: hypothetical protein A2Z06_04215 [Candidatus Glassbacteria bacterium RBG_16_58_8]|uniref:TolC family protein n=1 Tax=Candidatus Glassbacteria bacterium RBG_16_58_8 TaxID=1817866 RepID=A0A1F5YCB6_9BACT|nr:MAG: hypothetical protein A2Z06_04215 [Candidatus Glassbacteria bacterium RBG_16_58_8]